MTVPSTHAVAYADEQGLLTSNQVAVLAGVTYRMVDLYVRHQLITPVIGAKGSGTARLFHTSAVDEILELRRRIEACPFHPHDRRLL